MCDQAYQLPINQGILPCFKHGEIPRLIDKRGQTLLSIAKHGKPPWSIAKHGEITWLNAGYD